MGKRPSRQQTPDEAAARDRIVALAESKGVSQRELAEFAGMPDNAGQLRVSRWRRGLAVLPPEAVEAMEARLASVEPPPVPAGFDDDGTAEETTPALLQQRSEELRALAGSADGVEERDQRRYLAKLHREEAIGAIVKIMLTARSDGVRLKAAEMILDRADGRPVQEIRSIEEKAPVEDAELLDTLGRILAQRLSSVAKGASLEALASISEKAVELPEEHREKLEADIAARRAELEGKPITEQPLLRLCSDGRTDNNALGE